ncbi:MAG: hypothetical protein V3U22_02710 [Vicinamibacteria bacterium]
MMRFIETLTVTSLLFSSRSGLAAEPPNFVVIPVDDLGYTDIGVYGSSFYERRGRSRLVVGPS